MKSVLIFQDKDNQLFLIIFLFVLLFISAIFSPIKLLLINHYL